MRSMLVVLSLLLAACSEPVDPVAAELATCKAKAERLQIALDEAKAAEALAMRAVNQAMKEQRPPEVEAFVQNIKRDPMGWCRFLGKRAEDVFDEHGDVRDPPAIAAAVRAKMIRTAGKRALDILMQPQNLGSEVGAAVYYERIK